MALGYVIPSLIVTGFHVNSTDCENCINQVVDLSPKDTSTLRHQILILVSISTGISILNLMGMLVIYDRDPKISPNKAERRRSSVSLALSQLPATTQIKNYLKSVKKIIMNNNSRYLIVSQRKNSKTQIQNWKQHTVTVMLVTSLCRWIYDGDWFEMLVTEWLCWRLFSL